MKLAIAKLPEFWRGITRNRDIERSAREWMEGYDAALVYCAEQLDSALSHAAGQEVDKGYATFKDGHLTVDINAFLKSPEGISDLRAISGDDQMHKCPHCGAAAHIAPAVARSEGQG